MSFRVFFVFRFLPFFFTFGPFDILFGHFLVSTKNGLADFTSLMKRICSQGSDAVVIKIVWECIAYVTVSMGVHVYN